MEEQNDINHKERLKQSGFITKEEHRGKGGVEIWLNPVILGMAKLSTNCGDNVVKIGDVASLSYEKAKNFHPLVHEQQEQLNNNSKVDKSGTQKSGVPYGHRNGLDKSEATGTQHEQDKNTEENANPAS